MKRSQVVSLVREVLNESDEQQLAAALKAQFQKEFQKNDVNEGIMVTVLAWALASNTVLDLLGKYAAKAFRKFGFDKAANKADAIHHWAHENEKNFLNFIGGMLSPFIKDEDKRAKVAKALFIVILAGLGIKAGIGAYKAIEGAQNASAGISAIKAALKGRDVAVVGAELASNI